MRKILFAAILFCFSCKKETIKPIATADLGEATDKWIWFGHANSYAILSDGYCTCSIVTYRISDNAGRWDTVHIEVKW